MKKSDDVFLLTLVDLLLQLLFLGLVLFAVNTASGAAPAINSETAERLQSVADSTGFSSVTELTDLLTRMAPASVRDFLDGAGKSDGRWISRAEFDSTIVAVADSIKRGSGLPPCIAQLVNGRAIPTPIARVVAWDDSISVTPIGDSLVQILRRNGGEQIPSSAIPLSEFRRRFVKLSRSDCRYHAIWDERTDLVYARDTVNLVFYRVLR